MVGHISLGGVEVGMASAEAVSMARLQAAPRSVELGEGLALPTPLLECRAAPGS